MMEEPTKEEVLTASLQALRTQWDNVLVLVSYFNDEEGTTSAQAASGNTYALQMQARRFATTNLLTDAN
jgi:hypothetical protein